MQLAPSPINVDILQAESYDYDTTESQFLVNGFRKGFSLKYEGPRIATSAKNLKSALKLPDIVLEKINKEVELCRVAGPFESRPLPNLRISPIGLVPKKTGQQEFRLIHHLSYPAGRSLNDYIDPAKCTVQYTSFDTAVHMIQDLGFKCEMFKMDIKSAFRLLPVEPNDFDQLGFVFNNCYYFDKCLPFGCSISCNLFNRFADLLTHIIQRKAGSTYLIHYLDDFLGGGKRNSGECRHLMEIFSGCMQKLGVPIAAEKTEGPVTVLTFLGLELDSDKMEIRLPLHKVQEVLILLNNMLQKTRCTLKEMQSLIGVLNFACRAIIPGRPFCRRLIDSICGLTKPYHHLRINKGIKLDLMMWKQFFVNFNGIRVFHDRFWSYNDDVELFTDSAGGEGMGFGVYFAGKWMSERWPDEWFKHGYTTDITVLELFPIVVAIFTWGKELQLKKICFRSDNMAVCHIINKMTSKSDLIMVLLRNLTLKCLQMNIVVKAEHVPGVKNSITDALSRFQMQRFWTLVPNAHQSPSIMEPQLWKIFNKELLV
ncbi:uncharacterized protein LOC127833226 [Dreissena polymorpha]|uniref:uncharacterized protein LOC127833226 n=1 Tax=Dreissena polymorpha TaxID=45954 RepID=UPI0022656140|nr:uncharacterized protein LOC127833226 [Dreissena polymorpha]